MNRQSSHFPITFSELLGQSKAKTMLARAIGSNRLPHAFLFRGPDGVGKRLFARSLAASVNCRSRQDVEACGICSSCKKYSSGNHPDFIVISPEKNSIKIGTIREMNRGLSYPPYESSRRVVLIEDIHVMRQEAANSLLKTLEEPPENNMFILTAQSSREILPTISSRCQIVGFFSLSIDDTRRILQAHNPQLEDRDALLLSRLAEGSPGMALTFVQAEMTDILEKVVAVLHDPTYHSEDRVGDVLAAAAVMADLNEHLPAFFGLLRIWIRDLLLLSTPSSNRVDADYIQEATGGNIENNYSADLLFAKLAAIEQAEKELNRNCNRALVCEVLLFKLQDGQRVAVKG